MASSCSSYFRSHRPKGHGVSLGCIHQSAQIACKHTVMHLLSNTEKKKQLGTKSSCQFLCANSVQRGKTARRSIEVDIWIGPRWNEPWSRTKEETVTSPWPSLLDTDSASLGSASSSQGGPTVWVSDRRALKRSPRIHFQLQSRASTDVQWDALALISHDS